MKFIELAANLDRMEATSSRNELVRILSEVYRASSADELEPITYLIQGRTGIVASTVLVMLGSVFLCCFVAVVANMVREREGGGPLPGLLILAGWRRHSAVPRSPSCCSPSQRCL